MRKLNKTRRTWNTKFRRMLIVHPSIKTAKGMSGTIHDYVEAPVIATRGEWPIAQMVSDAELAGLAILYRKLNNGVAW